ncbi:Signal transduction histidine kinase [Paenibacillus sp. UNCCL117]|uniref:sensor histidine kinase n=1 Tax=unclassified Paenibacillus TaxID=185978 RepID=UPI00088FFE44|nr:MULTISPECIES: sensor histidine kinase [unclassified Paenibacillus]SDE63316.1 Signal transduction histidine kinase [Paenibacillus sp. cl123]SFW70150.1 Signal transduction histidine kinase [Paenibacillus sp. UNCCL117]
MRVKVLIRLGLLASLLAAGGFLRPVPAAAADEPAAAAAVPFSADSTTVTELSGPWMFYWERLLAPEDFNSLESDPGAAAAVMLPHTWGSSSSGTAPSSKGYGTYRILVNLAPEKEHAVQGLYIPAAATAYRLWINGELKAENGKVGTSRAEMVPKNYAKVVYFNARPGVNEVILQVSNFVQRKGGLWTELYIGDAEAVTLMREKNIVAQLVISIALLTLGGYHLALFALRKLDRLSLLIGIFCSMLSLRSLLLGDTLFIRFFPGIPWELAVKAEYLAPYWGISIFVLFVCLLYPGELPRKAAYALSGTGFLFSLVVLIFPARIFTYTMFPFQLYLIGIFSYMTYIFALAAYRRRVGALLNGVSSLIMFAAALNDILYYNGLVKTTDFVPYGVMQFIIVQTLIVALKFSKAYYKVEKLSDELLVLNATLEDRIKDRTKELERSYGQLKEANEHLKHAESSRQRLLANISHELGTPMTAVQGYLKAMLDGVIRPNDRSYLQMIYDKVILVSRLVQDLFDLSKLEAGKASFNFTYVTLEDLFRDYVDKYRLDVENRQLRFELVPPAYEAGIGTPLVYVDVFRMQQVIGNIVFNALKFTPPGGTITIRGELHIKPDKPQEGVVAISVSDTGTGIHPSVLNQVFDRFVKGGGSQEGEGSGLGLAIVKEIVDIHGGNVEAESQPGEGATFRFTLPVEILPEEVE